MPTRDEALAAFDAARDAFVAMYDGVPDEALRYLRQGDDYAFGGLVTHATAVLEHYLLVLQLIVQADFAAVHAVDPDGFWDAAAARAKSGPAPGEGGAELARMGARHADVVAAAGTIAQEDWDRKADVRYGDAAEPYPSSPADVLDWLVAHYREHIPQAGELFEEWRRSRAAD